MLLQMQTWNEVERYLEGSDTIIVPIGSTEQHGPNGLIGTDALTAEHVARGVGAATGTLVAPVIAVGMAQHHMAFTGSMTLKPSTLQLVIRDYVDSLSRHGFRRFFFINGHGGNIATVNAAFAEIHAERSLADGDNRPGLSLHLRSWWMGKRTMAEIRQRFGDRDGSHATISEVSMTQHLFPDAIKTPPEDMGTPSDYRGRWGDAEDYRRKFPDGRIGSWPQEATPEAGKVLYDLAVEEIVGELREFAA